MHFDIRTFKRLSVDESVRGPHPQAGRVVHDILEISTFDRDAVRQFDQHFCGELSAPSLGLIMRQLIGSGKPRGFAALTGLLCAVQVVFQSLLKLRTGQGRLSPRNHLPRHSLCHGMSSANHYGNTASSTG